MLSAKFLSAVRAVTMLTAGLVVAGVLVAAPATAAPATAAPGSVPSVTAAAGGSYVALTPARVLDTRTSTGGHHAAVKAYETVTLTVAGHGGVPATGAAAVALNVTASAGTRSGFLTVYPAGQDRPAVSTLNFPAGRSVPNLSITALGSTGQVKIYNGAAGTVQVIVDVNGFYRSGTATAEGAFVPLSPGRLLDTRTTTGGHHGPVGTHAALELAITGHGGVPASGVAAVALNVTVTGPGRSGYLTAYADGAQRPTASNLNFAAGQTVANMVVVRVGSGGRVDFYNGAPSTLNLVVDVAGYFRTGAPIEAGTFGALDPARLLDTRTTTGGHHSRVGASQTVALTVTGHGGVPTTGVSAVVLNVTVTGGTHSGVITVYPGGRSAPNASSLNFLAAQTVPNLVEARVGSHGQVVLLNDSAGSVDLVADVAGYYLSSALAVPQTSPGAYLRTLTKASGDDALSDVGCQDAGKVTDSAPHTIVLDVGAQSNSSSGVGNLGGKHGVRLTGDTDDHPNRILDAKLVAFVNGYVTGYEGCRTSAATGQVTVAVATNSSGDFIPADGYDADAKGTDWADNVIDPLNATAHAHLSVVGANDIESDFTATEAQAEEWEKAYLAATSTGLLFIGAASGCPLTLGQTGGSCRVMDSDNVWTQAQLYRLAHGLSPSRIMALPQIYHGDQAVEWANIDRTGAKSGDHINFQGALTQRAANSSESGTARQGWALLYQALSTSSATAQSLPVVSDLGVI